MPRRTVQIGVALLAAAAAAGWLLGGLRTASAPRSGAGRPAASQDDGTFYQSNRSPLVARSRARAPLEVWSFAGGVPTNWQTLGEVKAELTFDSLAVTSSAEPAGYQLESPTLSMTPGTYRLDVDGKVASGGLQLGVLDVAKNRWIANSFYSSSQTGYGRNVMSVRFKLLQRSDVAVVLANWAPRREASTWELRGATLTRTTRPALVALEAARAKPQITASLRPNRVDVTPASLGSLVGLAEEVMHQPGSNWEHAERIRVLVRGALPQTLTSGTLALGMWSLGTKVGLALRLVAGTSNGLNLFDSHATVEVWLPEERRWAISDPTFNGFWSLADERPLGVADIQRLLADGRIGSVRWHSAHSRNSIAPSDYYVDPLYLYRHPSVLAYDGARSVYVASDATSARIWNGYVEPDLRFDDIAPNATFHARNALLVPKRGAATELPPPYAATLLLDRQYTPAEGDRIRLPLARGASVVVAVDDSAGEWSVRAGSAQYTMKAIVGAQLSPVFATTDSVTLLAPRRFASTVRVRVWSARQFPASHES